jgi:hemolysin activation/secretion protein
MIMRKLAPWFLFSIASFQGFADEVAGTLPDVEIVSGTPDDPQAATGTSPIQQPVAGTASDLQPDVMLCDLKGIVLLGNWNLLRPEPVDDINGVSSCGLALIDRNPSFLKELEVAYLGKPLTQRALWELKGKIADFYKSKNQLYSCVSVPRQKLSKGILQIVVNEAKLGAIRSRGNKYFTGSDLMAYIRTKPGEAIVEKEIFEDVAWMNQNPFRRTDAIFVPGKKPGTADIELVTIDRWPYRVYVGADNTGTIATERDRLFFGFNFGKTILRDSQVSYQFTFSPNWNRFYAHTASARVPCPWRHVFVLWGGYSQVKPALEVHNQGETGVSWQVDGRYRVPIMETVGLMQTLVVGYDFKETSNRIKVDRRTTFKATADINQFMIGYELGCKTNRQRVTLVAEAYGNPGGITEKNGRRDYEQFRFDAKSQYAYLKVAHSYAVKARHGWWFSYDLSGQIASENLLPSEQVSLTGYNGVRGFEERIALVDNGAILNLAVETPHWSPAKCWGSQKCVDELYFLAFFDCGVGANHQRASGEKRMKSLGAVGPGVRYQFSRYVTGRLDYGFQLWHSGFHNPAHSRYNFGLIVSY